jgi:hypothetical protein
VIFCCAGRDTVLSNLRTARYQLKIGAWASRIAAAFNTPGFLVLLTALLTAILVQPGEPGSIDTARRLQVTHSLWTAAPAYGETDDPTFGIPGRNGNLYPGYGIGQSLVMLPADIVGTLLVTRIPGLLQHADLRKVIVTYTVSPMVCTLAVLLAFRFLKRLGFTPIHSVAGSLTLLFGTTFLHYTQNMMENNLVLLLTLTGLRFQYEWLQTRSLAALFLGALAFGVNLLTRLTTVLDLLAAGLFVLLFLWFESVRGPGLIRQLSQYASVCIPCYAAFLGLDRLYNYYCFGTWSDSYVQRATEHYKMLHPAAPPGFPWSTPFWTGFRGPLVTPEKSIFLYDPMLILLGIVAVITWRYSKSGIKAYVLSLVTLLLAYICFYAKFTVWSGDVAWGDRYVTTPVQLLALISVPLLLQSGWRLPAVAWRVGIVIMIISAIIQVSSVALWYPLEFCQMKTAEGHSFVIGLRFKNIVAVALGAMDKWHLTNEYTRSFGYRFETPYLYPFLIRKAGSQRLIADALVFVWGTLPVSLVWVLCKIRVRLSRMELKEDSVR